MAITMNKNGLGDRLDADVADERVYQPGPLLPDVGLIALVPEAWNPYWQPRQYVLSRLARYFQVVWVEPAYDWRTSLNNLRELRSSLNDGIDTSLIDASSRPGFQVFRTGARFPWVHRWSWSDRYLMIRVVKRARRILVQRGCQKIILQIWRPTFLAAIAAEGIDLTCYHIDDEYSFSEVEVPLSQMEETLIRRSNRVFVHSPELLAKKGRVNPRTVFFPNGVDYKAYSEPVPEPSDLAGIPHPRIGYTGFIKSHLDWPLLLQLSNEHPEWSFVFVGPLSDRPGPVATLRALTERPNVHFLGAKPARFLSPYPQHFDVCIMPYKSNDYTKYIYPLKLHEYLASGQPVVGTAIPSLAGFAHVIALAKTAEEWSQALHDSLDPIVNSPERCKARREVAREYDWNGLVQWLATEMVQDLGPAYATKFSRLKITGGRRKVDLDEYHSTSRERARIANLMEIIPQGLSSLLDIGGRDGYISSLLTDRFEHVTCLDLENPQVANDRVHSVSGNVTRLEYADNSFDAVLCAEVLEHIPPQLLSEACSEISRVAKHTVVVGVPYQQDLRVGRTTCLLCGQKNPCWGHINTFSELRLKSLFKELKQTKVTFVERNKDYTNALSAWLMDLAGNPWGTYEQEESCIHCGCQLVHPAARAWYEKLSSRLAWALNAMQTQFVPSKPTWIHMVFEKLEYVHRPEH
jgi:glycosyltransferase involved in cell wall biosynthesis/ubiquinone/menaquinone biosynthesis C-methylase UbiE